jgi:hypothetical protein
VILQANVAYAKLIFSQRLGQDYGYGGSWSPTNPFALTDCSGLVGEILEALTKGQDMFWGHPVSTESWPYDYATDTAATPGTVGPYGTIAVASLADVPTGAAATIAIHHGGGGANSHTNICVAGTLMEDNGDYGVCTTGTGAILQTNSYWTDWHYLPGPIGTLLQGLDYAGGRIGGAQLAAAGYSFVCRYLTDGGTGLPGKQLLPDEFADLVNNNIGVVFNWETTANRMLDGPGAGTADATAALAYVRSLPGLAGLNPAVYFSADWDVTPAQQDAINAYLTECGAVLGGPGYVGLYSGYWPVSRALDAGVCGLAWQTEALSGGNLDPRVNIATASAQP